MTHPKDAILAEILVLLNEQERSLFEIDQKQEDVEYFERAGRINALLKKVAVLPSNAASETT